MNIVNSNYKYIKNKEKDKEKDKKEIFLRILIKRKCIVRRGV